MNHAYVDNELFTLFSQDNAGGPPGEIIHLPEGIEGKEKRERGNGQDVEDHPANHVPFAAEYEDQGL